MREVFSHRCSLTYVLYTLTISPESTEDAAIFAKSRLSQNLHSKTPKHYGDIFEYMEIKSQRRQNSGNFIKSQEDTKLTIPHQHVWRRDRKISKSVTIWKNLQNKIAQGND